MDDLLRRRIIASYRGNLRHYGHSHEALFWSSKEAQLARFGALAGIGIESGDSLLDVGCGFADLYDWLNGRGIQVNYTGLDLSPDLLAEARRLHPGLPLVCGEPFALAPKANFDWVVLSGTLNWPMPGGIGYVLRVVSHMFALCRKGVAFNLLDDRYRWGFARLELQTFQPQKILDECRRISDDCRLVDDYLDNDFTIYLRR